MAWAPDYATVDELAAYMRIGDHDDDEQLAAANSAAARAIDQFTGRQFGLVDEPEARTYTPRWSRTRGAWLVEIDDVMTADGFRVAVDLGGDEAHGAGLTASDYMLRPGNAAQVGMPWTRLVIRPDVGLRRSVDGAVEVTATWGWAAVPETVHAAALLQGSRFATRRNAPFGVAGSPEAGSEVRLLDKVDPDVAVMLARYRRKGVVG